MGGVVYANSRGGGYSQRIAGGSVIEGGIFLISRVQAVDGSPEGQAASHGGDQEGKIFSLHVN